MKASSLLHAERSFVVPLSRRLTDDDEAAQHQKRVIDARQKLREHAHAVSGTGRAFEVCDKLD